MNVNFNTYGRQFGARSIFGGLKFGGLKFGAVDTPTPPDPSGWTKSPDLYGQTTPVTDLEPIPGYPGWIRQVGYLTKQTVDTSSPSYKPGYAFWSLAYGTTDGVVRKYWIKYAYGQPSFPTVSAPAGGTTAPPVATGGNPKVSEMQQALNAADAKDYDGMSLKVDGKVGPRTCSAAYQFAADYGFDAPVFSAAFFGYLGLPTSYASSIGNVCASYYKKGAYVAGTPFPEVSEEDPVPQPEVSKPKTPAVVAPPVTPPVVEEPIQAGFSWKVGLIVASALIGGALLMKSKKLKGKGKGYEKKSSKRKSASKRRR